MLLKFQFPKRLGRFRILQEDNYPFNQMFGRYLGQICSLGLSLSLTVEDLVGYIEDRLFEGKRLPDIPEGSEDISIRIRVEDADVEEYYTWNKDQGISRKWTTLYLLRMTLRLAEGYGTSLSRLTRLIQGLGEEEPERERKEAPERPSGFRVSHKAVIQEEVPETLPEKVPVREEEAPEREEETVAASAKKSAQAAKEALKELTSLTEESVVETNPLLSQFGGI